MTDGQGGGELTSEECIRAGMYWFGRSDFDAARAWWERALELDPQSRRAMECLRLLNKTSSTGFTTDSLNPFADSEPSKVTPAGPSATPDPWSQRRNQTGPQVIVPHRQFTGPQTPVPRPVDPRAGRLSAPAQPAVSSDPFDFAAQSGLYTPASAQALPAVPTVKPLQANGPWDEGPSRTSVVTLGDAKSGVDALAEATPLPELDRGRFFNRGDPSSQEEIYNFLRATGDLPNAEQELAESQQVGGEIVFDEPVDIPKDAPPEEEPAVDPLLAARDRFQLHDFDGALELLEQVPFDDEGYEEARNLAAEARAQLLKMYESKIGSFATVPRLVVSREEIIWLNLNHRAGFILSQIDGQVSYDDIISLSGMPRLDTVRILAELLRDKVITG